jgi:hypothetical protein
MGSMAAVTASGPQLAMGRVVGSLCVVTAQDGDYATGMLASWVSQVGPGDSRDRAGACHEVACTVALTPSLGWVHTCAVRWLCK